MDSLIVRTTDNQNNKTLDTSEGRVLGTMEARDILPLAAGTASLSLSTTKTLRKNLDVK